MDAAKTITQDTIKVFKNQNIQRRSKSSYTIKCHQTTSKILINGPYIDSFLSNEMKTVIDILEKKKLQTQSTNSHLKKILSNTIINNPTTTNKYINNTDSISGKKLTSERKKMDNPIKETEGNNNFFDLKEKEMQVNKTQSQNREKELCTDRSNLKNTMYDSSSSCLQCKKDDHEFMIECSECKASIHYQCTELSLYMIASLVKGRRKYSCTSCINVNEALEKYTKTLKTDKLGENEPLGTITEKEIGTLQLQKRN